MFARRCVCDRNRPQPCQGPMSRMPMWSAPKAVNFEGFKGPVTSFRVAGVAPCDILTCLISVGSFVVTGTILLQGDELHFSPTSLCGVCFSFCIPPPPSRLLRHSLFDAHNFHTYHLSHTTLSHTIFPTQLCHTASFTHNFVTQHLSHATLSHSIFHTQLCHTPPFTHNFVTHVFHTHNFVAPGDIRILFAWQAWRLLALVVRLGAAWSQVTPRHFAWQAWHLATLTFVLGGRRGAWRHGPSFRVAGALGWLWWL